MTDATFEADLAVSTAAQAGSARYGARILSDYNGLRWTNWQHEVVALLQEELGAALGCLTLADVDWNAWRYLFDQGRNARSAIDRALERDL